MHLTTAKENSMWYKSVSVNFCKKKSTCIYIVKHFWWLNVKTGNWSVIYFRISDIDVNDRLHLKSLLIWKSAWIGPLKKGLHGQHFNDNDAVIVAGKMGHVGWYRFYDQVCSLFFITSKKKKKCIANGGDCGKFGLVSLFNGISTFVGYVISKLSFEKNGRGTN